MLLGRFAVLRGAQEIPLREFSGRRSQQLLRLLALRRGALVPKDVIADALWPRRHPADAAGNIEVLVSRIRRALGDRTLIRTGPGGYSLAGGDRCWVDVEAFHAAIRACRSLLTERPAEALVSFRGALAMWCGEPLAEDTYAEWAQEDRRCLALALLDALEGAAAAALAGGDPAEAVTWAGRALAREPLRESSAMLVIQALAAGGDQAGALVAFDSFRRGLASEAGLAPSPAAWEQRQRILGARVLPAAPGPSVRHARGHGRGPLAGREEECAAILAAAAGDGPRVVLITGPAGAGKSRLLEEAARLVHMPVLAVQASAADQDEAWSLAGRLLCQARMLAGPAAARVPAREARALAVLVPGMAEPAGDAPDPVADEADRAFAFQGAVRLAEAAARPRCLITVDDAQWADPASRILLGRLVRSCDRVCLVAACQPDGGTAAVSAAELFGTPAGLARQIMLGPLPAGAVRALFSDVGLADIIIAQTSAAPFPVTEVITALAARQFIRQDGGGRWRTGSPAGAAQVRAAVDAAAGEVISSHIAGLTAGPRELLALLALLGRPAPPALLAEASGRELPDVLDGLATLAGFGLSQPGPDGWTPGHERISQVLTATLDPASKACLHARLAQALRHRGADTTEVAGHLLASGDPDEASAAYAAAAARRLGCLADDEALRLADAGLSLQPTGLARRHLLETRAETRCRRGMLAGARADFKAALEACDDPADRSRILTDLALLEARSVSVARGEELAELAIAEAQDHPGARGQALAAAAIIDLPAGNLPRAERHLRRARRLLGQAGETRGTAWLLYWQAMASYMAGRLREAATRLGDLAHLPVMPAEMLRLWSPQATRGHVLALLAEPEAGLAEIAEALTWARARRYPAVASECLWRRSEALAFAGRAGQAAEAAEEALAIATRIGHAACTAGALRGLGIAWETAGKTDQAEAAFRRSLESAEGNPFFAAWASARLGACLARQGRPREAEPHVQAALSTGTPLTRYEARWAHAELLAARGDDQACRTQAADALRVAREGGCLVLVPHLQELARS